MGRKLWRWVALGLFVANYLAPAHAAFITIDDSHPDTITLTAGDFEGGFSVNGTLLTTGLGATGSITLPDEGYFIEGSWIDGGAAADTRVDIFFALLADPSFATSGVEFGVASDGTFATLSGSVGGFIDPSLYFPTAIATFLQDGRTESGATAFLSVSFTSEPVIQAVPEPSSLALFGGAMIALVASRSRRSRR